MRNPVIVSRKMTVHCVTGLLVGSGWLLISCSDDASDQVSGIEILAESATAPDGGPEPSAALASTSGELAAAWDRFGFTGEPDVSLAEGPVLFIGTFESGSCRATVDYVGEPREDANVEADVFVEVGHEGGPDCTADANPVSFVIRAPDVETIRSVFVANEEISSPLSGLVAVVE